MATSITSNSDPGVNFFLRPDTRYSINVLLKTKSKMESNDVGDIFFQFLRSLDQTILLDNDPRLKMTDDSQSRLTLECVKTAARDISEISQDPDAIFQNLDTSKFHLIYRAVAWSRRTPVWSGNEHFVCIYHNQKGCYFRLSFDSFTFNTLL